MKAQNNSRYLLSHAVSKGVIKGMLQDWRTVLHVGANKLNDCVLTLSFSLPTIKSLLQIVDKHMLMANQDIGEMFLGFYLHPNTVKFACIDIALLELPKEDYPHQWMCWTGNLMGFKAPPYNLVHMYLVTEEVIWGDCHDKSIPFQWEHLRLNLPGTRTYKPSQAWISKCRADESLASNFVCFVDNQQLAAATCQRIIEAGHTTSTRKSCLGIQDALCKIRAYHGLQCPGARARTNVCIEEGVRVMVLMSQEEWDQLKAICVHRLDMLQQGKAELEYKRLLSDWGFLVYVTQTYPGMKPYLKEFNLLLETWSGGRDSERWKTRTQESKSEDDDPPHLNMGEVKRTLLTEVITGRTNEG
jgi:hypothetical protein